MQVDALSYGTPEILMALSIVVILVSLLACLFHAFKLYRTESETIKKRKQKAKKIEKDLEV